MLFLPVVWTGVAVRDILRPARRLHTLALWLLRTATAAALVYLLFLLTWGLNYRRVPLERKLAYDSHVVTSNAAREAARRATSRLNVFFAGAHAQPAATAPVDPVLAAAFASATREVGAAGTTVPGRPKRSLLDIYFRPAGVAGMTDPFFLETLIEGDLLAI